MLERLKDVPAGVDGFRAAGSITREDYDAVVLPILEEARRGGRRVRLLAVLGPESVSWSPSGFGEAFRVGVHHLRRIERCAVVSDLEWVRAATELKAAFAFATSCSIKLFHEAERSAALQFLTAPAERPTMPHRIVPGTGVLILEPQGALRQEDFEAVAAEVDPWIEAHGALNGVVIHGRTFPGWENLGGLISHLEFVRDHQKKVRRVALATDTPLAGVAEKLASHFVAAEVKLFRYADATAALAWAGDKAVPEQERANRRSHPS